MSKTALTSSLLSNAMPKSCLSTALMGQSNDRKDDGIISLARRRAFGSDPSPEIALASLMAYSKPSTTSEELCRHFEHSEEIYQRFFLKFMILLICMAAIIIVFLVRTEICVIDRIYALLLIAYNEIAMGKTSLLKSRYFCVWLASHLVSSIDLWHRKDPVIRRSGLLRGY